MKRFKNVLVLYDDAVGGDDALGQAVALARENSAHLTISTVLRDNRISPGIVDETHKRLHRLASSVRHADIGSIHTKVLLGTPFLEIIRQVIGEHHDLVITGAEAGSVIKDVFFGNTGTHLMRKCPCPVWVVKPGQAASYRQILAAVDPQLTTSDDSLNINILDLATSLASRNHAVLHVLHAWDVDGRDIDTVRSETSARQREVIYKKHLQRHRDALNKLLARYSMQDIDLCLHLPRDRPERAISQIVEQEKIDLITMGTVARTGIPGIFIGNTAEAVLSSVKCGMLTVKPDDFETPVSLAEPDSAGNQAALKPCNKKKMPHVA